MGPPAMNTATGKRLLALVRDGDYAHPGEEEAIRLLLAGLRPDGRRRILDAGCGGGGTAAWVQTHGYGTVTGLEIDPETVRLARERHPEVEIVAGDLQRAAEALSGPFDLIYSMTALYAVPDQHAALTQLGALAAPGAELRLFEYADPGGLFAAATRDRPTTAWWRPLDPRRLDDLFAETGWAPAEVRDLKPLFERWYGDLYGRITDRRAAITRELGPGVVRARQHRVRRHPRDGARGRAGRPVRAGSGCRTRRGARHLCRDRSMSPQRDSAAFDPGGDSRAFLASLFDAAVAAADPAWLLPGRLPPPAAGRTAVVGAGKAAAAMAAAVEREWNGPLEGLVVTRYGHGVPCSLIEVVEAAHPVPDAAGFEAAGRILALAQSLSADDLLVCLISGGGSALLALPAPGVTLEDKQSVNRALLRSGATITEMNCVRKHLSAIKGGRLAAAAHPARVVTYLISDVPGDDPSVIASGPTVPDASTFAEALEVLARYGITGPAAVLAHLRAGAAAGARSDEGSLEPAPGGAPAETPKPTDPAFANDEVVMLATATDALAAAAGCARAAGVTPLILGDDLQGEARELGGAHAALAIACARGGETALVALREAVARGAAHLADPVFFVPQAPVVLLSGGETTVTVSGTGRGGRCTEYLLSLALALDGHPAISALAADTDGIDGSEDNAGALVTPDTLLRARQAGRDPIAALAANDAYGLFAALGDLVVTGPTRTNVNDFRAVLVL